MNENPMVLARRRDWLSLGHVSRSGPISCDYGRQGHLNQIWLPRPALTNYLSQMRDVWQERSPKTCLLLLTLR